MESLACPRCNCQHSKVLETRELTIRGNYLKMRVRECRNCKKHFKTKEIVDQDLRYSYKKEEDQDEDNNSNLPESFNPYNEDSSQKDP
tara:strand:+ start:944 stop:1207 length:264 start_codon:yes stop_codon:yes gene_type:complete